ncbi:MAG: hypothetical protein ABSA76_15730 [Bacteroidales bacterium]
MKTVRPFLLLIYMAILPCMLAKAQDKPLKVNGFNVKVQTLSNGKYCEFFDQDVVVEIGSVLYNTETNKIVGYLEPDTSTLKISAELLSRWLSVDPLAAKYYSISPYVYVADNPIKYIDPNGKEIRLVFQNDAAKNAYLGTVNKSLGGFYTASVSTVKDGKGYNNQIVLTATSATGTMTGSQKAFYSEYNSAVTSGSTVRQNIVSNDAKTVVGSWVTGKVDMADVAAFDKAGKGAATSAGALIHETSEQLEKAKLGLSPNDIGKTTTDAAGNKTYVDYESSHNTAIQSENNVNGNTRVEDGSGTDTFKETDGTKTTQTVTPNSTGDVTVTKTKIP